MFICYSELALSLIVSVIPKIIQKVSSYKLYKTYESGLKYLKAVHKERYKLYFTGSKEEVEKYSAEIEQYGKTLLDQGEITISNNLLSKKHSQMLQEILKQTKELMTTIN